MTEQQRNDGYLSRFHADGETLSGRMVALGLLVLIVWMGTDALAFL